MHCSLFRSHFFYSPCRLPLLLVGSVSFPKKHLQVHVGQQVLSNRCRWFLQCHLQPLSQPTWSAWVILRSTSTLGGNFWIVQADPGRTPFHEGWTNNWARKIMWKIRSTTAGRRKSICWSSRAFQRAKRQIFFTPSADGWRPDFEYFSPAPFHGL